MTTPDRIKFAIGAGVILAAQAIPAFADGSEKCPAQVAAQSGSSLSRIGIMCGVSLEAMKAFNPQVVSPDFIIQPRDLINTRPGSNTGGLEPVAKTTAVSSHPDGLSPFEPLKFSLGSHNLALEAGSVAWYEIGSDAYDPGKDKMKFDLSADLPPNGSARIRVFAGKDKIASAFAAGCSSEDATGALRVSFKNEPWDPMVHMTASIGLDKREGTALLCAQNTTEAPQQIRLGLTQLH